MGTQANNEAFQEAATTEKSKTDHHMLQSHKQLSSDQKINLTIPPSLGVQTGYSPSALMSKVRQFYIGYL